MNTVTLRQVRVASMVKEANGICRFELSAPNGDPLPTFSAGSHIDVHLGNGLVRQYSLCNSPLETHRYEIAVLLDPNSRGGSSAMHDLEVGSIVNISEPRNHFPLSEAPHSLLLAGGIGITPLLSMAEQLSRQGASFELHYCTRSAANTAFATRLESSDFAERVHIFHDDAGPTRQFDLETLLARTCADGHLYVCGPTGFMNWVLDTARSRGWTEGRLHREYFSATTKDTATDQAFDIQIASTGRKIRVEAGQTVIAALKVHGIHVPTSCEQGVCGACLTPVLGGTPDHRDMFLTPDEQALGNQFTPCCSRSKSECLVLDLQDSISVGYAK